MQNPAFRHLFMPMTFGGSGGGGGGQSSSNTVTQVQQIPEWQQSAIQNNEAIAQSLASTPYPVYNAPIVAPLNSDQMNGLSSAYNNAFSTYVPGINNAANNLNAAEALTPSAINDPTSNSLYGAGAVANMNMLPALSNSFLGNQQMIENMNVLPGINNYVPAIDQTALNANPMASTTAGVNQYTNAAAGINPMGVSGSVNALTGAAQGMDPVGTAGAGMNAEQAAAWAKDPANAGVIQSYMNPYVENALKPQLQAAQNNLNQQQQQINAGATSAGAFGDARQGMANAYQNWNGQQTMAGIEANGYNTAYNSALQAAQNEQGLHLNAAGQQLQLGQLGTQEQSVLNQLANTQLGLGQLGVSNMNALNNLANTQLGLGQLGVSEQGAMNNIANNQLALGNLNIGEQGVFNNMNQGLLGLLSGSQQQAGVMQNQQTLGQNQGKLTQAEQSILGQLATGQMNLGTTNQQNALTAANSQYNVGNIEQQNQQAALNAQYQQFLNQVNWPYQQLNVMESAVNSSPYQIANATTLPNASPAQSGLGSFTSLASALGSLKG